MRSALCSTVITAEGTALARASRQTFVVVRTIVIWWSVVALVGGATVAAGPVVPAPEECRVAPRSSESLTAMFTIPHPHSAPTTDRATPGPVTPRPSVSGAGQPADQATVDGVKVTAREAIACLNAGDILRRLALFSDRGIARFVTAYGLPPEAAIVTLQSTPVPVPLAAEQRVAFLGILNVRVLTDGRVSAIVVQDAPADPRLEEEFYTVYVRQEDRWLIDDIATAGEMPATSPTAVAYG